MVRRWSSAGPHSSLVLLSLKRHNLPCSLWRSQATTKGGICVAKTVMSPPLRQYQNLKTFHRTFSLEEEKNPPPPMFNFPGLHVHGERWLRTVRPKPTDQPTNGTTGLPVKTLFKDKKEFLDSFSFLYDNFSSQSCKRHIYQLFLRTSLYLNLHLDTPLWRLGERSGLLVKSLF